jgi:hypothetical protein
MATLVVAGVSPTRTASTTEARVQIFPGGATPSLHPADSPFWVGYGFVSDPDGEGDLESDATRFELDVDGVPVAMLTELHRESAATVRKTLVAEFPAGLRAGWHDFTGRWYDDGRLILSSRAAIQFVDR